MNIFGIQIEPDISPYRKLVWKRENVYKGKVPNKPGIYRFYDKKGKVIYVGHASRLRHRVQSYIQDDDFSVHNTKEQLRKHINSYSYKVMPKERAKRIERQTKTNVRFNYL